MFLGDEKCRWDSGRNAQTRDQKQKEVECLAALLPFLTRCVDR